MPNSVKIQGLAALKILLHTAKYPHAYVCGILLGPESNGEEAKDDIIDDAIPLFHHTTLSPLLETAFTLVEQYALKSNKRLAGYYYAPEKLNVPPEDLCETALSIADKIQTYYSNAIVLKVDNFKIAEPGSAPFLVFQRGEKGEWKEEQTEQVHIDAQGVKAFDRLLASSSSRPQLVDMDEHFDDVHGDFRNLHINKLLLS